MRGLESGPGFLTCKPRRNVAFLFLGRNDSAPQDEIPSNSLRRVMHSPGLRYLCRLLCPAESRPCPLITVNDKICQMCLDTFPQAGDLVDAFHLPVPVAARRHGMPVAPRKFRNLHKRRGITRWPYRLLRHPSVTATRPVDFVEDLMADLVTCLAAEEDLRAVPTVVPTDLPAARGSDCYTDACTASNVAEPPQVRVQAMWPEENRSPFWP